MNILILANHYPAASGRYAETALKHLGHTVYTNGPSTGRRIWGLSLPPAAAWAPSPPPPETRLDLAIVMDSDPAILDASEILADAGVPVVVWGVDNHVRTYRRPWIHRYYLAHREVSYQPWGDDCLHLPCAGDPGLFLSSPVPWANRQYDVAVLGMMYPQRMRAVEVMKSAGLSVIWGCGLVGSTLVATLHQSRVSLCLPVAGDLAQRVFECAQAQTAVLTTNVPDLKYFATRGLTLIDPDKESIPDAVRKLVADGEELAVEGSRWASKHSWFERASSLISLESWVAINGASQGLPVTRFGAR